MHIKYRLKVSTVRPPDGKEFSLLLSEGLVGTDPGCRT